MSVEPPLRALAARVLDRVLRRHGRLRGLAQRAGWMSAPDRVRWFGARTVGEGARSLAARAAEHLADAVDGRVILVGEEGPLRDATQRLLDRHGWAYETRAELDPAPTGSSLATAPAFSDRPGEAVAVLCTDRDARRMTETARRALEDPRLAGLPFEYVTGLQPEIVRSRRLDEDPGQAFVSPVLLAEASPYEIYEESLRHFEQKCALRDYLDLYQFLTSIEERDLWGDVAEFGSYRGHSGWLIARTLEALGSDRRLHMYDTFERFPEEPAGIDQFWSGTHPVRLEEVRARLAAFPDVRLVPGEFESTLPASGLGHLALAYIDCDSYRAVRYLADALYGEHLVLGGMLVFEDYGHPALLGCRVAIHEAFDGRRDCLRFFSPSSGLYVVVKLGG